MVPPCNHEGLNKWVGETAGMCRPEKVHWCDGSRGEYMQLMADTVRGGAAVALEKRPESYLFRSDPGDVARVESRTFISTASP